jgi:hypothetical protein
VRAFGVWELLLGLFYYVISALLAFVPVIILKDLVQFLESGKTLSEFDVYYARSGLGGSGGIGGCAALGESTADPSPDHLCSLRRLCPDGRVNATVPQGAPSVGRCPGQDQHRKFVGMTVTAPLQIILALVLIYQQVGNATWVGVGFMILLAVPPINVVAFFPLFPNSDARCCSIPTCASKW